MPCERGALDCATACLADSLRLHCTGQGQWSGPCPICGGERCFSLTVKGRQQRWHCNRRPPCPQDTVTAWLAARFPNCIRPGPREVVTRGELEKLLGLSGAALQLRVACLAWDCTPQAAAEKLGM